MTNSQKVIHIEPLAPAKPASGKPCNGCGVCCLVEPCPLGMVLSGRRSGACAALRWNQGASVYRCGAIAEPVSVLQAALPSALHGLAPKVAPALARVARRLTAAGVGCDSSLEPGRADPASDP